MERSIEKAINEYRARFYHNNPYGVGKFNESDIKQLHAMSNGIYSTICNSLEAGFMIGYKCAQMQSRKNRRG